MKYNQFIELDKILEENNININNIKKNPEVLNEIGITTAVTGLLTFGLAGLFNKALIRLGIKKIWLFKLKKIAEKFEKQVLEQTSIMSKKSAALRQEIVRKGKELKAADSEEASAEYDSLLQKKRDLERRVSRDINEFILTKMTGNKTKEIYQKIDEKKRLKESQKTALKNSWDMLIINIRMDAFKKIIDDGIITDPDIINSLKQDFKDELKEKKNELKNIKLKIDKDKKESGDEGDPNKISAYIEKLDNNRDTYSHEELGKKLIFVVTSIYKTSHAYHIDLFNYLSDLFGEALIIKIRKKVKGEKAEKQETLKNDEL